MEKQTKQELKYLVLKFGSILVFCLLVGVAYAFIQTSSNEREQQNKADMEAFSRCVSDGRMYWNSEEQRCYEKQEESKNCKDLFSSHIIVNLPDYIDKNGTTFNLSDCNQTLIDGRFECYGIEFWAWAILEDVPYQQCIDGFTIGMHDKYGHQDVRYLGKDENASSYMGMIVIPFDESGCEIPYYRVDGNFRYDLIKVTKLCWE